MIKICSRYTIVILISLSDKCTKRVRDQIDGYSDSLAAIHHKLDQVIAYCVDKKEREEVINSENAIRTYYKQNMFTEPGGRRTP